MLLVRVAVPVPALEPLTYRVPDHLPTPVPGARVLVPLGTRVMTGLVVTGDASPAGATTVDDAPPDSGFSNATDETGQSSTTRDVIDVLDSEPFLNEDVVRLALWVAEYYACGAGDALGAAMPPRAWIESERYAQLAAGAVVPPDARGLRRDILERLGSGKPARVDALTTMEPGFANPSIREARLIEWPTGT